MLGQGKAVREIAETLNVTVTTINTFRNRIREKLGLKSSTAIGAGQSPDTASFEENRTFPRSISQ